MVLWRCVVGRSARVLLWVVPVGLPNVGVVSRIRAVFGLDCSACGNEVV